MMMMMMMMGTEYELITGYTSFNKCTDFFHNMQPVSKLFDVQNALKKNRPIGKSRFNTTKKGHLKNNAQVESHSFSQEFKLDNYVWSPSLNMGSKPFISDENTKED
jgi:hypothetical protein